MACGVCLLGAGSCGRGGVAVEGALGQPGLELLQQLGRHALLRDMGEKGCGSGEGEEYSWWWEGGKKGGSRGSVCYPCGC